MSEIKQKKRFFTSHAKSSAFVVSLFIHAILILVAVSFVAVTVYQKEETKFEYKKVTRPKQALKKLQVPVKVTKKKPTPKLRKRVVAKDINRKVPDIKMPEVTGVKGGLASMGDSGGVEGIGFTLPEIDFFGAKAKGEKVVFVVHFGPATIQQNRRKNEKGDDDQRQPKIEYNNPFTRMTGYTIRKRLEELVAEMPAYTLFNVVAYFAGDCWAMEPEMMLATPDNKQKVMDWMAPVNPLEGDYDHCFSGSAEATRKAYQNYPTRVDKLPFYATKWCFPYYVPTEQIKKYAPDAPNGFMHWGRGLVWALLEQKPDTIFVLTTNYIDGWREGPGNEEKSPNQPGKMAASLKAMATDVYGKDKKRWPSINVVVLAAAGKDATGASNTMGMFDPIVKSFNGTGSIIEDITDYMTDEEKKLFKKYQSQYGNRGGGGDND